MSLSIHPISWDEHQEWFESHLDSPRCLFYMATDGRESRIGQIRFDLAADTAVVSVSLAKEWRGHGLGASLIRRGSEQCFAESAVSRIRAYIKPHNESSIGAFASAGFTDEGTAEVDGHLMRQFAVSRVCRR